MIGISRARGPLAGLLLGVGLLGGCHPATDDSAPATPACDSPGEDVIGVVNTLTFAHASEDGLTSSGFDLDGAVTAAGDATGCGIADYLSPDGAPGVDNGFAKILPALEMTEASAVAGLIQDAIDSGALLFLFDVSGVDDRENDPCVQVSLMRGVGTPSLGTDGTLEWSQTFDVDPDREVYTVDASIVDGRIVAAPLPIVIPVTVLGIPLEFALTNGSMQIDLHEDGSSTGVLGGSVDTDYILSIAEDNAVDDSVKALLESLLAVTADMAPDDAGVCQEISINFEYTGIPAYVFAAAD